jgi:hypothetical protein
VISAATGSAGDNPARFHRPNPHSRLYTCGVSQELEAWASAAVHGLWRRLGKQLGKDRLRAEVSYGTTCALSFPQHAFERKVTCFGKIIGNDFPLKRMLARNVVLFSVRLCLHYAVNDCFEDPRYTNMSERFLRGFKDFKWEPQLAFRF